MSNDYARWCLEPYSENDIYLWSWFKKSYKSIRYCFRTVFAAEMHRTAHLASGTDVKGTVRGHDWPRGFRILLRKEWDFVDILSVLIVFTISSITILRLSFILYFPFSLRDFLNRAIDLSSHRVSSTLFSVLNQGVPWFWRSTHDQTGGAFWNSADGGLPLI